MRIGIYFNPTHPSGGERYFRELIRILPEIGPQHQYIVYFDEAPPPRLRNNGLPLQFRTFSNPGELTWKRIQMELPKKLREDRIDLFHSHFSRFPISAPCQTVVTIHDAIPVLAPRGTIKPTSRSRLAQQLLLASRLADHLIVSSRHTKQLFMKKLHISSQKMTQIYLGCPRQFYPVPRDQAIQLVRRRFRLSRPYLLSVGPLLSRKNHPLLIRAFRKKLSRKYDLVLVGELEWWGYHVLRLIGGDRTIHYLGPVSDHELLHLYSAAECLAYPSKEEGFGFPPLEAMACGTPVVASRSSSIAEVVGNAGLLVETRSVSRLAHAMQRIVEDKDLSQMLRHRGLKRVLQFQWEETARKTLEVYRKVVNGTAYQGTR